MTSRRIATVLLTLMYLAVVACNNSTSFDLASLASAKAAHSSYDFHLRQQLINDAPIGPGMPQASTHCPTGPGRWHSGSGRSTGESDVFGELTETEVYCINGDLAELTGGLATRVDAAGDSISMTFGAKLLEGFVYPAAPSAPLIGFAQFTGGTGKWRSLTGAALFTGSQNDDGSATLEYRGTVYLPR